MEFVNQLYESESLKYDYDTAEIHRNMDDLLAFMKAIENIEKYALPTQGINEALGVCSESDREIYELISTGVDE